MIIQQWLWLRWGYCNIYPREDVLLTVFKRVQRTWAFFSIAGRGAGCLWFVYVWKCLNRLFISSSIRFIHLIVPALAAETWMKHTSRVLRRFVSFKKVFAHYESCCFPSLPHKKGNADASSFERVVLHKHLQKSKWQLFLSFLAKWLMYCLRFGHAPSVDIPLASVELFVAVL